MQLRPYQDAIIDDVLLSDEKEIIIELPTGAGKSVVIAELARLYKAQGEKVVVLTETSALIEQLDKHLKELAKEPPSIIKAGKHRTGGSIYLVMEQSFHENKRIKYDLDGCVLVRDEIHKGKEGKRFNEIVEYLNPKRIIGLSATPYNEKGVFCGGSDSEYIVGTTMKKLTEQGYLVPIKYYIPKIVKDIDYSSIQASGNDFNQNEAGNLMSQENVLEAVYELAKTIDLSKRKTLIICSSIEQAEKTFEVLQKVDKDGACIHSKKNEQFNEKAIELFKNNKLNYLVSVSKLAIGFDAPNADTLINLRPTKVLRLWVQIAGRIARLYEGKEFSELYDFGGCLLNLGYPDDRWEPPRSIEEAKKKLKERKRADIEKVINYVDDELINVSKENVKVIIEEIKRKENIDVKKLETDELIKQFHGTTSIERLVRIANEIHRRKYGWCLRENTIQLMIDNAVNAYEILDDVGKGGSTIKAYRTRLRNILNQNKKLASFIYFPEWFLNSTKEKYPWIFVKNEEEEPF